MAQTPKTPDSPAEEGSSDSLTEETEISEIEVPIDGTLDLHTFRPSEVGEIVPAYLEACAERGIRDVRIVHGKGVGHLRRSVEALLRRHPLVERFAQADESAGGWGSTLVTLKATLET